MPLLRLTIRRVLQAIPTMLGLLTLVFFLSRLLPGDPANVFISPGVPSAVAEHLRTQFGLDRPLGVQYLSWLGSVLQGELGFSFSHRAPVKDVLSAVFPNTVILASAALLVEILITLSFAALSAVSSRTSVDKAISVVSLVVYSLPSFFIGIVLLTVFSFSLGIFPSSQMYSVGVSGTGDMQSIADLLAHLTLPALTLAIPGAALLTRYLQTGISQTQGQDYILASRAMGISKLRIYSSYLFPNAVGPTVALLGIEIGTLLTGVLVTETLFSWPGMGRIAVLAVFARDYPLILGCTIIGGIVVVTANLAADILNAWIDPRIRIS
ncbi:MAG TPA: ABC transporter permease [Bacteroidota bacterium]